MCAAYTQTDAWMGGGGGGATGAVAAVKQEYERELEINN
jgi:hypothetical protein